MTYLNATTQTLKSLLTITFVSLLLIPTQLEAQSSQDALDNLTASFDLGSKSETAKATKTKINPTLVLGTTRKASFTVGTQDLATYLKENVAYPEAAKENGVEGTTIIRFRVLEDGSLAHFSIKKSTHPTCDEAVINTLQNMPKWTPGMYNGKKTAMWRQVAVDFSLGSL